MSSHQARVARLMLAVEIVKTTTQIRIREGTDLFEDEMHEIWDEARRRNQDELEDWLGILQRKLFTLPRRRGAGQLDLALGELGKVA